MDSLSEQRVIISQSVASEFAWIVHSGAFLDWLSVSGEGAGEQQIDGADCETCFEETCDGWNWRTICVVDFGFAVTVNPEHGLLVPVVGEQPEAGKNFLMGIKMQESVELCDAGG